MAQTTNDGDKTTEKLTTQKLTTQKLNRPGQRQQERLQRIARRKKRQQIILSTIVALVLIGLGITGLVQYQNYTARQQTLSANATGTSTTKAELQTTVQANATVTAGVNATATVSAQAVATALGGTPVPTAGASSPPVVTQTPKKTPDGLQIVDIKTGSGPTAKAGSTVTVEYTGWLQSNGKKFDSSFDNKAQTFDVGPLGQAQVIQGWNEGLIGVQAGTVRRLIIPPALAYGSQAQGPIPANSTLIFDIVIVAVK